MEEQFSMDGEMMKCIGRSMILKKCCGVHIFRIAVGMIVLGLLFAGSANAATFTVCHSGCEYSSIQKAINASSNGDTILVKSGTYFENVNVTKQLILHGIGNPVVDAGGSGSAITLVADGITLEGFTATGSGDYYESPGAEINVTSNNNTLTGNNASKGNEYGYGWGISLSYSSNNTLTGNTANSNGYGTGIRLDSSNNNTLIGNNASKNNNLGIYLQSSSNNTMRGNIMTGNQNNFNLDGYTDSDFDNHIDKSNLVDGRPLYYIINASDVTYDSSSNAGTFYCISCINVTIKNLTFNKNGKGIFFRNTSQSRIQNVNTSNNYNNGILLQFSNNNTLTNNTASSNNRNGISYYGYYAVGISLVSSSNNKLIGNNASNNQRGIYLEGGSNNTLSGNIASNNYYSPEDINFGTGITLGSSSNNTLNGNNASNNGYYGISLGGGSNNTLSKNIASNNHMGIYLYSSSSNTLSGNNASNNYENINGYGGFGIYLQSSSNNTLSGNMMTGNRENFNLDGDNNSNFDNHIDKSNLVDGRPIYYIIKASDTTYDSSSNAGTFYCISCVNVTLRDLNLKNNGNGIFFWNTSQSRIQYVNASNNHIGIFLSSSSNNTLTGNTASSNNYNSNGIFLSSSSNNTLNGNNASNNGGYNGGYGIYLSSSSSNNTLSGNNVSYNLYDGIVLYSSSNNKIINNIFNNNNNFYIFDSNINTWNTTRQIGINIIGGSYIGGNFWANPNGNGFSQTCPDVNGDGICDQSYILDGNNADHLPLAKDKIPPKSVSKLKNVSYASSYINWTWTDPKDSDFDKVQIYINNKYKTSVLKGVQHYKAKNLYANRSYTISTRTVDKSGNVKSIWKNDTSRTKPDIVPPMNVTNLKNITYARNYINWTWKDPRDIDFKKVMVFIDSKFKKNVSKGKMYYNATNFTANTMHTISTRTVDMNGNINKTWTNHSAWTAKS